MAHVPRVGLAAPMPGKDGQAAVASSAPPSDIACYAPLLCKASNRRGFPIASSATGQ
jgi:hypothetical protein